MGTDHIQPLCAQESKPQDRYLSQSSKCEMGKNLTEMFCLPLQLLLRMLHFFPFFPSFLFFPLLLLVLREIRDIKREEKEVGERQMGYCRRRGSYS